MIPDIVPSSHGAIFAQSLFPGGIPEEGTLCPAQPLGALIHVLLAKGVPESMWTELRKAGVSKDVSPQGSGQLYLKCILGPQVLPKAGGSTSLQGHPGDVISPIFLQRDMSAHLSRPPVSLMVKW